MKEYTNFANLYDRLMEDLDYDRWMDYLKKIFLNNKVEPKSILECACGTGEFTTRLKRDGYLVTGLDNSSDMLTMAENKARSNHQKIKFIKQNMAQINLNQKYDAVLCLCDGVNYLTEDCEVEAFFKGAYNCLEEDGILIFDVSSVYKLSEILGNNTFFYEKDNVCYAWENYYDEKLKIINMDLNFFVEEDTHYNRFIETHTQRGWGEDELTEKMILAGFKMSRAYNFLSFNEPNRESERIFFVGMK